MRKSLQLFLHKPTIILFVVVFASLFVLGSTAGLAATKTWVPTTGGAWTTAANWNPAGAPAAGDDVVIPADQSANITAVPAITLNSLTVNGNCLWAGAASGNTITITTSMSIAAGKTLTLGATGGRLVFTLNGTATVNGNFAFDAGRTVRNFTVNNGATLIVAPTGRVYDPTLRAGSVFILNSGATLRIGNTGGISTAVTSNPNVAVNFGGSYTYGTGANYVYNGTAAQVTGNGLTQHTPGNVTISNSAGVTLSAATTVGGDLTISSGATLATGNFQVTLNGNFINNGGTFTAGSSPIVIAGTLATQNIAGFTTTGLVSMTKTAGTATFTGNVNGSGITINGVGGTLNLGTGLTHTFTGTWTRTNGTLNGGSSTMIIGGNVSGTGGTFTANTGTVQYNAAGAQTVAGVTYNNLTLSGGGAKTTTGGNSTVNGILTLTSGVLTTGADTLSLSSTGSVSQTTGWVAGNFRKYIATGATSKILLMVPYSGQTSYMIDSGFSRGIEWLLPANCRP